MTDQSHSGANRTPTLDGPALVTRIQRGDEAALRIIVDAYWRPLVSYATGLLNDPDTASDVVQESLSHVWLARDHLSIRTSLKAYLYRMVHNRAMDERRRVTRRERLFKRRWLRSEPEYGVIAAPPERLPLILEQALASLPERRGQVFILAHLHDLTYKQIAEILDLSPQTVANHITRALADLRRMLAPHAAQLGTLDNTALRHHQTPAG